MTTGSDSGGAAAAVTRKIRAYRRDGTLVALGFRALADLLTVTFQKKISASASVELGGDGGFDLLLRLFVGRAIVLVFLATADAHQHLRTV
jgi:hypothetical protein